MFVTEKMPDEAKLSLPFDVVVHSDGEKPTLRKWAVDEERNAYIVLVRTAGGPYEGTQVTEYYILNWGGSLIPISAEPLDKTFVESQAIINWRIIEIGIPESLQSTHSEVMQMVDEAFKAIGQFFDGDKFLAVEVDFNHVSFTNARSSK